MSRDAVEVTQSKSTNDASGGPRFGFGENWSRYLKLVDEQRIVQAEQSLQAALGVQSLKGKRFVDVGSGSGIFSLAALRLGARVHSFDFDAHSVGCTMEVKRRFASPDAAWVVEQGSALDCAYLQTLGVFDIVYCWGVLHHTGQMWNAMTNVMSLVADEGRLHLAIYNDQGRASRIWWHTKKLYCTSPRPLRALIVALAFLRLWGPTMVRDLLNLAPGRTWRQYGSGRGMSPWRDVVDWVGGFPFEVARPEEVFRFHRQAGFRLDELKTCGGGHGCNEYVFTRTARHTP